MDACPDCWRGVSVVVVRDFPLSLLGWSRCNHIVPSLQLSPCLTTSDLHLQALTLYTSPCDSISFCLPDSHAHVDERCSCSEPTQTCSISRRRDIRNLRYSAASAFYRAYHNPPHRSPLDRQLSIATCAVVFLSLQQRETLQRHLV